MLVKADGTVQDCTVAVTGDLAHDSNAPKAGVCPATIGYEDGYADGTGVRVDRRVTLTQKVEVLPVDAPQNLPPAPSVLTYSFVVEPDGSRSDCRIEKVEGADHSDKIVGPTPCGDERFVHGYVDVGQQPKRRRVTTTVTVNLRDEPPAPVK
jgi:hypothetical protein